ncbi:MAG: M48 family metallopeptidase [bacterium]|nr:M48 family metallopeptidase [bacterium]
MPVLVVADTEIPYEIGRSQRAKRMRITVRPGSVDVIAPRFTPNRQIVAFAESKRRWIYEKTEALRERELVVTPPRFLSGSKVLFRGRFLRLWVQEAQGVDRHSRRAKKRSSASSLRFASAFHVTLERGLASAQRETLTRDLVMDWLKRRALADARVWARQYGSELGVSPARIRIGNQRTLWGSCSARGVISLNWRLIAAPKPVFEYVVVHELCHLIERNHGKRFWKLVGSMLPDYPERRTWLQRHGVALS